MKAARFYQVGQPLRLEEVPTPQPGPGEVLIRVRACGICGSDIHIVYEGVTPTAFQPIILGHEFSGEVAACGPKVATWRAGDRVAVNCLVSCGRCRHCRAGREQICQERRLLGIHLDGGLAEYAVVPAENLVALPGSIPFDQGAILTDAVATPYHALTRRGRLAQGETVAVIGCGGLGLHAVQLAKVLGAGLVVGLDLSDQALERARARGADRVIRNDQADPAAVLREAAGGEGVDLSVECIGRPETIALAAAGLRTGGRAVIVGLGAAPIACLPPTEFVRREIELRGSYAFTTREIAEVVALVAGGRLNLADSVSRRVPLEGVNEGLQALHEKIGDPIRIVVTLED
ncbi:MAG: zinc-binding dehydrogenase [Desulfobacterota bacterium]|jgi:2-desacetyl-2-hydroxyethyl bacteriochlorophyllide A dehydrogenase|nr:zinc-binding dehydrogenase [Thermodesulfobacteriota bacterium]